MSLGNEPDSRGQNGSAVQRRGAVERLLVRGKNVHNPQFRGLDIVGLVCL